ncbi:DNA-binding response regulator [Paenibacillus sp. 598K]|uniref:helix-turn-helix domain-containing protein n=1 Tax=Paenibacillus sp. 598K TaxID=1117987 RepID=UPI000FF90828|nr:helix-turn-helix domain-containing protein [Paenibacillus sp. 598K]GBF76038.1 DNA-binding response regulator [Paenibacillus sp. 598K]
MKVLIVDDEQEIREGLRVILGAMTVDDTRIEVVGAVGDAIAALEFLGGTETQIVITDIRMPGMDGLGMAETIRYRYPAIQIIVLSGYGDFAYMQRALRLSTVDYLLKPVDEQELERALLRAADHSTHRLRTRRKNMPRTAFEEMDAPWKLVLAADIDTMEEARVQELGGAELVSWLMVKVFEELADELGHLCYLADAVRLGDANLVIGAFADSQEEGERIVDAFAARFTAFWRDSMKLSVSIGMSAPLGRGSTGASPYYQACQALLARLFRGSGIYRYDADQERGGERMKTEWHALLAALETANEAALQTEASRRLDAWLERGDAGSLVRGMEAMLLIMYELMEERQSASSMLRAQATADLILKWVWVRNEAELRQRVQDQIRRIVEEISPDKLEGHVLVAAKAYIRGHLTTSFTLADVAAAVYVSPHYLSHLFRERSDMTFLEYVTALRMEEAKQMLREPGAKIYEVAEQVGYKSWKHFSRVFKDFTGIGPADYRRDAT